MERQKEKEQPEFDINDRGFNVKAWYLIDTELSKGNALIEIRYKNELIREFIFPAYKIYNIAAHFRDIVDGELVNSNRGYQIAASTGLEGLLYNKTDICPICNEEKPIDDLHRNCGK